MSKPVWASISIPEELKNQIIDLKPEWMSLSEFTRNALAFYIAAKYPTPTTQEIEVTPEVQR